jgi:hypothetical protein
MHIVVIISSLIFHRTDTSIFSNTFSNSRRDMTGNKSKYSHYRSFKKSCRSSLNFFQGKTADIIRPTSRQHVRLFALKTSKLFGKGQLYS